MTDSKTRDSEEPDGLPSPPAIAPRLRFTRKQLIGIPLILAIPILAVLGVFGERADVVHVSSPGLDVRVSYPKRMHYRQVLSLRATVRNVSPSAMDTIKVSFDTAYIARFSSVRFDPPARQAYVVDLMDVKPGESRLVAVEMWGQDYGRHAGTLIARTGSDSVTARFRTIVFP